MSARRQRRMTSSVSSSESRSRVRSSAAIVSSAAQKPVASRCGTDERSLTVRRWRQRRTVVSLIPSSRASSATGRPLAWM
jgi:hypothetical protein